METITFALGTGQVSMRDNLYDIVAFFMESSASYLIYALLLWAACLILWRSEAGASDLYSDDFEDEEDHKYEGDVEVTVEIDASGEDTSADNDGSYVAADTEGDS